MMMPIMLIMLNVLRVSASPSVTPTSDSGSENMMASGCVNEPNCEARIR